MQARQAAADGVLHVASPGLRTGRAMEFCAPSFHPGQAGSLSHLAALRRCQTRSCPVPVFIHPSPSGKGAHYDIISMRNWYQQGPPTRHLGSGEDVVLAPLNSQLSTLNFPPHSASRRIWKMSVLSRKPRRRSAPRPVPSAITSSAVFTPPAASRAAGSFGFPTFGPVAHVM